MRGEGGGVGAGVGREGEEGVGAGWGPLDSSVDEFRSLKRKQWKRRAREIGEEKRRRELQS